MYMYDFIVICVYIYMCAQPNLQEYLMRGCSLNGYKGQGQTPCKGLIQGLFEILVKRVLAGYWALDKEF